MGAREYFLSIANLRVHPDQLVASCGAEQILLTPLKMKVLIALAGKADETVRTDELLILAWVHCIYDKNPVKKAMSRLWVEDWRQHPRTALHRSDAWNKVAV
ncbi:MAG: response regulator transcription factor [Lysobacter sp.]|nr:response regulator transcription factor [Lysobacter sp.]